MATTLVNFAESIWTTPLAGRKLLVKCRQMLPFMLEQFFILVVSVIVVFIIVFIKIE
jgi:hypothetical protein